MFLSFFQTFSLRGGQHKDKRTQEQKTLNYFFCPYVLLFIFKHKDKKAIRTQDFYFLCPYGLIFV